MRPGSGLRRIDMDEDGWQALVDNQIEMAQALNLTRSQIAAILEERFGITTYEDEEND